MVPGISRETVGTGSLVQMGGDRVSPLSRAVALLGGMTLKQR